MNDEVSTFMTKLIDWKSFELFAADLYKEGKEVLVEHDKMEVGKSNARYQIDVKVTKKDKLHTYVTLVECKSWKQKVDRHIVNVMFSAIEDLNASKGVIFTTKGYETGAIEYAKSKGIEIFIVRDLTEDEWGKPGKVFWIFLQLFNAKMTNIGFQNAKYISPLGFPPPMNSHLNLDFVLSDKEEYDDKYILCDLKYGNKKPNLVKILVDVQNQILKQTYDQLNVLFQPESEECQIAYIASVSIDFTKNNYRFLKHGLGFIMFDSINFELTIVVNQNRMNFDRTAKLDFALIVENYLTKQINYAIKNKGEDKITLSEPINLNNNASNVIESETLKNGTIFKIGLKPYVDINLKPNTMVNKINNIIVNLKED